MRPLKHRVHEWLADHVSWVQYPRMRIDVKKRRRSVDQWLLALDRRQRGWVVFAIFWTTVVLIAIYGSSRS